MSGKTKKKIDKFYLHCQVTYLRLRIYLTTRKKKSILIKYY